MVRPHLTNTSSQAPPATPSSDATRMETEVAQRLAEESRKRRRGADKENLNPAPKQRDTDVEKKTTYQAYGRHVGRLIDFSQIIDHIIETGIRHELEDDDEDEGRDDSEVPADKINTQRQLEDWETLCRKIAGFKDLMMTFASKRALRHDVARHLTNGVEAVCCDDRAALKERLPSFILFDTKKTLDPAIATSGNKGDRGFHHFVTGALLCPITLPATKETFDDIVDGRTVINAKQLPRFLYPHDRNDRENNDILDGVFHGYLMIRTAKFILIGRSCALAAPGASTGRRGNASLSDVTTMTPRIIAYIAVQLHFALSSQSTWGSRDRGRFDYVKFYWNIVSFFKADPDGGKDIIEHYNYQLWGDKAGASGAAIRSGDSDDTSDNDDDDDGFALLRAAHAAKRARVGGSA